MDRVFIFRFRHQSAGLPTEQSKASYGKGWESSASVAASTPAGTPQPDRPAVLGPDQEFSVPSGHTGRA